MKASAKAPGPLPPVAEPDKSAPSLSRARVKGARAEVVDEDYAERTRRSLAEQAFGPAQAKSAIDTGYGALIAAARASRPRAPVQAARAPVVDEDEEARTGKAIGQRAMQPVMAKAADDFGYSDLIAAAPATAPRGPDATGMPGLVRGKMEAAFGADFSDVRVQPGSTRAVELGALAFTQGSEIHVAPGQWAPETKKGQELLGHELAHVVQQSEGRVQPTVHAKGMSINADPALEREADVLGAKAARGEMAASKQRAPQPGHRAGLAQAKADPASEESSAESTEPSVLPNAVVDPDGESVSWSEETSPTAQAKGLAAPIQALGLAPIQGKKLSVPCQVKVTHPMTGEEYKIAAMLQLFGGVVENLEWKNIKKSYVPEQSPYTLHVEASLLKRHRSAVNKSRGIDVDEGGGISGAEGRAKKFDAAPSSDPKSSLMNEIDRRYYDATGTSDKIKKGEKGKADLWRQIRDEVLFQDEYIKNMPPNVKMLIKQSIHGKDLTPADYDQLFRIAKKIEALPQGQAADYASKVTGTTADLNVFEKSLETYSANMAKHAKETEEHKKTMMKLVGLEKVYEKYKEWVTHEIISPGENQEEKAELEKQLKAHDFAGTEEFKAFIDNFLKGFETESAKMVDDLLQKYAGRLYREGERYQDQKEVSALHGKLGGVRSNYAIVQEQEAIMQEEYAKQKNERERSRLPGHGGTTPKPTAAFKEAEKKGLAARDAAAADVQGLAAEHPIFLNDDALPLDRRINKIALATATETSLQGVLLGYIAQRNEAVKDARGELAGNSALIYKMEKMMPQFYLQQGIVPGSIHDEIVKDKMREDRIKKIVLGILAAIAAIALTIVSLGTATPAIIAAGAAAGAFGLSAYMAYDEYKTYAQDKKLSDVGLVDDPSVVWLVIAVVGAALDMGAAVKAVRALGPAAKALNAGAEVGQFNKVVRTLEQAGEIDSKIARAAEKAALAKQGYAEASSELGKILAGRAYSFPGPLTDPDVYKQLVKMAAAKFKEIGNNGLIFIEEVKKARLLAKNLPEMSPEEFAKVKQAWEEGMKQVDDAAKALAPSAERITELKKALSPALPQANDLSGPTLVMFEKVNPSVWPKFKTATPGELEKLGAMLIEDPTLAERILAAKNPYGALKKSVTAGGTLLDMDHALFTARLGELNVNATRIGPAIRKSGISPNELAKLTDADIKALGEGDRLLGAARQGYGPSEANAAKLAEAAAEFEKISGVSKATRDELRASVSHSHGLSDLPFMRNPGEALAAKFPGIPKAQMDELVKRHPDALRALETATQDDVQKIIKALEENPKDVEDILRSYMYKAQKRARKGATQGLDVPDSAGERIGDSLENLKQARAQGHPFGFKDKAQYEQFISTVDSEVAARGIKGKAKVQGSAMHSKAPNDIDMEIVVDQAEFDRLAKQFLARAPGEKQAAALKISIDKRKIPSYEFFPDHKPSIGETVKKFTQSAEGAELDVQATLIVRGSEFDLGPFL